ncbi:MAG: helix-turn-helix domain-containing protein [Silicimonas sp.]|nr:helix-turn-helix domain-containing protein [Silicimonas sp.]NNF90188.1 helix-turn-helix transcriptional regulator [Boseongicola sp.]RZW10445.1 MAG: XRE family transcriptional regulator [Paracoccaceae bacterium]MBT8424969.1 helix-turn-helix domain-containing protein [Silicimonas sp.]NND18750.1 helix-turn-helix transcriptional regulator [Silicimonas sp.]
MSDTAEINWYSNASATFGDRIAAAREARQMSQKSLAKRLGVGLKTIEGWENDLSEPRANKLQTLSGVLNVSIPWLLTGDGTGIEADVTELAPADTVELIAEMRVLRADMLRAADRLGIVEKRLANLLAPASEPAE